MDELIKKSQELVRNNVSGEQDDILIELLGDAVLSLLLIKPTLMLEKLPECLRKLDIIADERSVLEIVHEDLGDYMEDGTLKNSAAAVIRELSVDNDDNLDEVKHLLVSLKGNSNYTDIICILSHELIHLLRFSWSTYDSKNEILKVKEGIEISTYDGKKGSLIRRNQFLEEGIVQFYANMAIKELADYTLENDVQNVETLKTFKKEIRNKNLNTYLLQTSLIEKLSFDLKFFELLDETFEEMENHSKLEKYFNSIMNSSTAFSRLSKLIDTIYMGLVNGTDKILLQKNIIELNAIVQEYFFKKKGMGK